MKQKLDIVKDFQNFIETNEVVYQVSGELVEVSNEDNQDNRNTLLEYLSQTTNIVLYEKGAPFIHEACEELDNWATSEDSLYMLEPICVAVCIPHSR